MKKILSICIATYNRKNDLQELIFQILTSPRKDFFIEITDNASDDGTVEMLKNIDDERIIIHQNRYNIGGKNNTVKAIFNCLSQYCLYLNDRELFNSSRLDELFNLLNKDTYAYVYLYPWSYNYNLSSDIIINNSGIDTLKKIKYTCHPSGMVFNADLIHKYFDIDTYLSYQGIYSHSILAVDLTNYGKFVTYNLGIWNERPQSYKIKNVSRYDKNNNGIKETVYFHWKQIEKDLYYTMKHFFVDSKIIQKFSYYEKVDFCNIVLSFFFKKFTLYKITMFNKAECYHYKIKREFISTYKYLYNFNNFSRHVHQMLQDFNLPIPVIKNWQHLKTKRKLYVMINSIVIDFWFIIPEKLKSKIKNLKK